MVEGVGVAFGPWKLEAGRAVASLTLATGFSGSVKWLQLVYIQQEKNLLPSSASPLLFGISLPCHVLGSGLEGKSVSAIESFVSGCWY